MWLWALMACADLGQLPACDGVEPVQGTASAEWTEAGGIQVAGTALHPGGLALRSVRVGEHEVTADGFNYASWSVLIGPADAADMLDDQGALDASVVATDACDVDSAFASVELAPDDGSGADAGTLALQIEVPGGASYLPADGSVQALVTVMGDADAAGRAVELSATLGSIEPGTVTLALDGDGATATAAYVPNGPGPALLTAVSGDSAAFRAVQNAGPPVFIPDFMHIEPGEALGVQVSPNGGVLDGCSAAGELGVFSGGTDLTASEGGADGDADGLWDLFVTAPAGASAGDSVVITCTDVHDQAATGVVEVPDLQP